MDFRIGPWLIRPAMNRVVRGLRSQHVTPKSMEVLVCLARGEGRVVSKDELFQEVWPGTFVGDDSLTRCVGELRRIFHSTARDPAVIETIPKRGYRIAARIEWCGNDGEPPDGCKATPGAAPISAARRFSFHRRWLVVAGVVLLAAVVLAGRGTKIRTLLGIQRPVPSIASIAVLPLTNLSGDAEQEYFAEGMTDELITELAQIEGLRVVSRTSVLRYKDVKKALPEIARDLGAEGIVEGTLLRSGNKVRITAQLIHAATDTHVWAGSFEHELTDVIELQRTIARSIAAELKIKTGSKQRVRAGRNRRMIPEAYEDFLKGRYFLNRGRFAEAALHFEHAGATDPQFALSFALLAEAHAMECYRQDLPPDARVLKALERARALEPDLAEVHTGAGDLRFYGDWDWSGGEAEFRRAVELDPDSVDAVGHYMGCLSVLGRWDEAIRQARHRQELDPVSPRYNAGFIRLLVSAGKYDDAIHYFRRSVELDPNNSAAYREAGYLFQRQGKDQEAIAAYLKADGSSGRGADDMQALEEAARTGGVHAYWRKRIEMLREAAKRQRVPPLEFSRCYLLAGDNERAIEMLEVAFRERAAGLVWIASSGLWAPLRSDPRMRSIIRRMRFPGAE